MKDLQLSVEFVAGLAFGAAFAKLSGQRVSMDKSIQNDESVDTFTDEQLEDPWQSTLPSNFTNQFPELRACDQVG